MSRHDGFRASADGRRPLLLVASFALLFLVAAAGPSAAKPGLGPRGWAPGDLPLTLSSGVVTATLAAAYVLGCLAVGLGLWRGDSARTAWWPPLALAGLALMTAPFGSADHTNYAAYGRIAAQGGDPYLVPPVTWAGGTDPVTSAVEPPWTMTPSIYGPLATALQALCSLVGQDNLRQTVWAWQVIVVTSWLLVRLLLRRAVETQEARSRVDLLWTLNPVVFGVVVLGAHVDVVATAVTLAALVAAARSPLLGGAVLGAAVSTKITYAVAGLAILWSWRLLGRNVLLRKAAALALGALPVLALLHLWAGPHVFDQLGRARRSVSFATPWRPVVELLTGPVPSSTVRNGVFAASAVVIVALVVLLARLAHNASRTPTRSVPPSSRSALQTSLRATFVLGTAYALGAPYALPWYDALTFATLPAVTAAALDGVLLARLTVMALAYVPGRVVAMSASVEALTLGFRRSFAPYAGWLVWAAICWLAWRGRPRPARRPARRPAGPGR